MIQLAEKGSEEPAADKVGDSKITSDPLIRDRPRPEPGWEPPIEIDSSFTAEQVSAIRRTLYEQRDAFSADDDDIGVSRIRRWILR